MTVVADARDVFSLRCVSERSAVDKKHNVDRQQNIRSAQEYFARASFQWNRSVRARRMFTCKQHKYWP